MRQKHGLWWLGLGLAIAGALLAWSIHVRVDDGGHGHADVLELDPSTGALLVDLDDDASSSDRADVARLLVGAIAPFRWPGGESALGERLSAEAQLYRLTPPPSEIADVMASLRRSDEVEGVEIERTWSIPEGDVDEPETFAASGAGAAPNDGEGARFKPNDPYYQYQWHLDQIQMPGAWTQARGRGAVVAVIDTGVLYRTSGRTKRAPDLARTKFVPGYDFVDRDDTPDDEHGHGTHCAGTVAQSTNNSLGVAGVAPEASIMPLRVLDRNGSGNWGAITSAVRWAADHGANVISMSLGGGSPSVTVQRAIEYAHSKGVTIIAAAGNASRGRVEYPGGYEHVIAVGAVRFDETLSFYSSYGRGLDIVAPGGDLRVDQNGDGRPDGVLQNTMLRGDPGRHDYLAWQGTSMATPHVAGVAALLYSKGVRDPGTIEGILLRSAKKKADTKRYGAGLLQANDALRLAERGLGGMRGLASLALGALVLFGLRRRGALAAGVGIAPTLAIGAAVAGVLAIVPWDLLPWSMSGVAASIAAGVPASIGEWGGPWAALVAWSALVPVGLAGLLLGKRRLVPLVVAVAIGFAGFLAVEALVPTGAIAVLPAWIAGPWLLVNAVAALALARLAAHRA